MILWIILTLMACAACVAISVPFIRTWDTSRNSSRNTIAVYDEQQREVDREHAAGVIDATTAEFAKIEIQRRMLASVKDSPVSQPLSPAWRGLALISTAGFIALASVLLYAKLGNPTLQPVMAKQTSSVEALPAAPLSNQVDTLVANLETRLQANPADAEGWRMLGWSHFNMQRYPQSAEAYAKAVALDPANLDFLSAYAEAQVQAAQGLVTPQALTQFQKVLGKKPKDPRSRFYEALALEQGGDKARALDNWLALLADTPDGEGWLTDVRSHIADLGKALGRDVSAQLQTAPQVSSPGANAPEITQDDIASVQSLPAADQQEMVRGMVDRLAARLESEPKDEHGWIRLMRSRMVLQQTDEARGALDKALTAFNEYAAIQARLKEAAIGLGIVPN